MNKNLEKEFKEMYGSSSGLREKCIFFIDTHFIAQIDHLKSVGKAFKEGYARGVESTKKDLEEKEDLLETAWGIIANAYGGDWDSAQNKDWKPAAEKWRDRYHKDSKDKLL